MMQRSATSAPTALRARMIGAGLSPLWWVAAAVFLAAMVSSPGFFNTDELIYYHAARAVAATGTFEVRNGYEVFGAEGLRLWFLVAGPNGLAPQYPSGYALAGAPLVALLGPRGLILLNAGAAVATVFLCRALARRLYGDDALATRAALILALATFLADYALAIWPHALAMAFVTAAMLFAAGAVLDRPTRAVRSAVLAGLMIGAGMLVRVDTVLIVPPLALWVVLCARRPVLLLAAAALGLLPGLAAGALLNWIKFGEATPISYGAGGGGNVDPASYLGLAAVGVLALLAALALRWVWQRPRWYAPAAAVALLLLAGGLFSPQIRQPLAALADGAVALLIDITAIDVERARATVRADGTLSFWGLTKKALGQSLPWIGALAFLLAAGWRRQDRAAHLLCLLVLVLWPLPFLLREWHGGLGSNMRYFLAMLPALAILAAYVWRALAARAAASGRSADALLGAALGLAGLLLVVRLHPGGLNAAQQVAASWLLGAVAVASAAAAVPGRAAVLRARLARVAIAAGFCVAFIFGVGLDPLVSQHVRDRIDRLNAAFSDLPPRSLVYGKPLEAFSFQLDRPDGLLAGEVWGQETVDAALIDAALAQGYRAFVYTPARLDRILAADPTLSVLGARSADPGGTLFEVGRPPPP